MTLGIVNVFYVKPIAVLADWRSRLSAKSEWKLAIPRYDASQAGGKKSHLGDLNEREII